MLKRKLSPISLSINHPVPFPIVHLTKREKLSLLLHDCIVYELEACSRMPIHGREYYRCKVNSFEKCIQKPLYLNEPIYHLVKSCLKCEKNRKNPYGQLNCMRNCYVQHIEKKEKIGFRHF